MRFVHTNQSDSSLDVLHHANESLVVEALRGAVQYSQLTLAEIFIDLLKFIPGLCRVHTLCRDAFSLECIDLIFHQSNQWGDDSGDTGIVSMSLFGQFIDFWKGDGRNLDECQPEDLCSEWRRCVPGNRATFQLQ